MTRNLGRPITDIVIVGDSLTAGEHASDRRRTYPALVIEALARAAGRAPSVRVVGLPGGRVADLLAQRPPPGRSMVVVECGTNDWIGYRPDAPWAATPIADFRDTYARLLELLVGAGEPLLICLGVWGGAAGRSEVGASLDDFDNVIASECAARGGRFAPLTAVHDDQTARGPAGRRTPFGVADDLHPNDRGHRHIAELVLDAAGWAGWESPARSPSEYGAQRA